MNIVESIVLGFVQGLTEFLPVSSSGHLVLFEHFMGNTVSQDLSFEVMLHFGSLLAVILYFKKDIGRLFNALFHCTSKEPEIKYNLNLIWFMLISTIVTGVIGFTFKPRFESMFGSPLLVAIMLSVTGIIVFMSDKVKKSDVPSGAMGIGRALIIGLGQAIAITPGISRSGTTIAVSLYTGIKREDAAVYSFLLSVPAILGASLSEVENLMNMNPDLIINYIAGIFAAFVSGYMVIHFLLSLIKRQKLKYFSYYCWGLSVVATTFILMGY